MKQETQADLDNETAVINKVCKKWDAKAFKNPCEPYHADYTLLKNDKVWALAEVKCRGKKYDPYKIGMNKMFHLASYALAFPTINIFLIVRWTGHGIYFVDVQKIPKIDFSMLIDKR